MHLSFPCHIRHKGEDTTANERLGRSGSNVENNKIRDPEINEENPGKSLWREMRSKWWTKLGDVLKWNEVKHLFGSHVQSSLLSSPQVLCAISQ